MEREMENRTPTIIDLNAELANLTMFRGRTAQTTFRERRGSAAQLAPYRDGFLLLSKFAGKSHWEAHPEDELFYVLGGAMTVDIVCDDGPPKSIAVDAGMMATVPQGAWHRVHSADGVTVLSATLPSDHIDLDIDDPRSVLPPSASNQDTTMARETESKPPSLIDLQAELAKLTMFWRTPNSTVADRKGSVARLASYRDGLLLAIKASGKDHWERHLSGDELIHVLDGTASLEICCDDGPPKSFVLSAGMVAVIPQGAWHRFHSLGGFTQTAATPFPGDNLDVDVDDPRTAEHKPT
jgi:mannose-6-phosphate isomerase-like protein (cupin superfamily)